MTQDFQFTDSDTESNAKRRDPSEMLDFKRIVELDTPRGKRPGKLIIVRPLEKIRDWRETDPEKAWKTLVVADIAVLEGVPSTPDEFGQPLPPIAPGTIYRNLVIFPGMLCKAWRDQVGNTLIGVLYLGPNEKGQPPFLWRSLAKVQAATDLGRRFIVRFPNFLIPVPREPEAAANAEQWATDPWGNAAPPATPVSPPAPAPWDQPQPVSPAPAGGGHQQADPWASASAGAASSAWGAQQGAQPVSAAPAHPNQGINTLEQLKAQKNAQGSWQEGEPPF